MKNENSEKNGGAATERGRTKRYRPGDIISIEVDDYEAPFEFAVKLRDYQKLKKASRKELNVYTSNFLKDAALDWPRLEPLVNEDSPEFDMTLADVLVEQLLVTIGLAREATAKKRSPDPTN